MNYQEIEPEFTSYVEMAFESDERVKIIFEALANMQDHPYASPKLALQIAIEDLSK
tara:strand:+ start:578 stop:745 length:168 start_codon:yes stop_codon:yes gene_type:complete